MLTCLQTQPACQQMKPASHKLEYYAALQQVLKRSDQHATPPTIHTVLNAGGTAPVLTTRNCLHNNVDIHEPHLKRGMQKFLRAVSIQTKCASWQSTT